jgi:hypothetical protein
MRRTLQTVVLAGAAGLLAPAVLFSILASHKVDRIVRPPLHRLYRLCVAEWKRWK